MAGLFSLIGTAVSAAGTIAGGAAAKSAAQAQAQMNEFRAQQAQVAAGQARAGGQRDALERRRDGALAQSKLQAQAAASGGGASDPTIIGLGESIAGRSKLGALTEMFKGESKARGLLDQATLDRMAAAAALAEGEARQTHSYFSAGSSLLSGFGSAFSRYGSDPASSRTRNPRGLGSGIW
jgi:hypothetical protein